MASPGAICLISGVNDPGAVFALSGKVGRSPRVFAARDRDGILRQMQAAALKRMGITLAGEMRPSHLPYFGVRATNASLWQTSRSELQQHVRPSSHARGQPRSAEVHEHYQTIRRWSREAQVKMSRSL